MPRIRFKPSEVCADAVDGANIRDVSIAAGVEIPSTCGGVGSCGLCKVRILAGAEHLGEMTELELNKLGNVFFITKERLSCQTLVQGEGEVDCEIPEETRAKAKKVQLRKDGLSQRGSARPDPNRRSR